MCTRPDRSSVSGSFSALRESSFAFMVAFGTLAVSLVLTPVSLVRGHTCQVRSPRSAHIDVQVHLEDSRCVAELRRVVRQTVRRAARTWAPLPLPVDRVVVGMAFPAAGRVDLYERFPDGRGAARPLAVVSLGLRDGDRSSHPPKSPELWRCRSRRPLTRTFSAQQRRLRPRL